MIKKIAIASDHAGFELKEIIKKHLENQNIKTEDLGTNSEKPVDYPDFGKKLGEYVIKNKILGIAICGTGIGISISAGKIKGIRSANCTNTTMAKLAKNHNNSNVLGLGARLIGTELAKEIVDSFLKEKFDGERHKKRVDKIE